MDKTVIFFTNMEAYKLIKIFLNKIISQSCDCYFLVLSLNSFLSICILEESFEIVYFFFH